ncbi:hypothetical protein KCA24_36290, partial [Escherichia coli]|nr:hypothetical protein [Escherichia coli]
MLLVCCFGGYRGKLGSAVGGKGGNEEWGLVGSRGECGVEDTWPPTGRCRTLPPGLEHGAAQAVRDGRPGAYATFPVGCAEPENPFPGVSRTGVNYRM